MSAPKYEKGSFYVLQFEATLPTNNSTDPAPIDDANA
jgi:hypothetical protein